MRYPAKGTNPGIWKLPLLPSIKRASITGIDIPFPLLLGQVSDIAYSYRSAQVALPLGALLFVLPRGHEALHMTH
jgi:hypothetical protein